MFRIGKDSAAIRNLRGGVVVAMGQRAMPGFYFVDEAECTKKNLKAWREAAKAYAESLPPK
jgi:hypothetical protein